MAEPDFLLCDKCGGHLPRDCRMNLVTGREMDSAGSMDSTWVCADLCHSCLVDFLKALNSIEFTGSQYEVARRIESFKSP